MDQFQQEVAPYDGVSIVSLSQTRLMNDQYFKKALEQLNWFENFRPMPDGIYYYNKHQQAAMIINQNGTSVKICVRNMVHPDAEVMEERNFSNFADCIQTVISWLHTYSEFNPHGTSR